VAKYWVSDKSIPFLKFEPANIACTCTSSKSWSDQEIPTKSEVAIESSEFSFCNIRQFQQASLYQNVGKDVVEEVAGLTFPSDGDYNDSSA
jgi:hypothetical protein